MISIDQGEGRPKNRLTIQQKINRLNGSERDLFARKLIQEADVRFGGPPGEYGYEKSDNSIARLKASVYRMCFGEDYVPPLIQDDFSRMVYTPNRLSIAS